MKKLSITCILVAGIILISGCIDEEKTNSKTSTSPGSPINKTPKETSALPEISEPEMIPGEFGINITSYYFVYMRENLMINENISKPIFDLVEKNYVIYHLSIKNKDTNTLNFSINKLQLHATDQVFTPVYPDIIPRYPDNWVYVLSEIKKENRLNDTQLYPGQIMEGIVIFQVDNYTTLFDRSFSLKYNRTPISSTSYKKSLEALTVAEQFDYSIAFDMPPYDIHGGTYSYSPPDDPEDPYFWANWRYLNIIKNMMKCHCQNKNPNIYPLSKLPLP